MRTFLAISDLWGVTEEQRLLILGYPSRSTYHSWCKQAREHGAFTLDVDVLTRISAVLGIHQGLGILFPTERLGVEWLRAPHSAVVFGGLPRRREFSGPGRSRCPDAAEPNSSTYSAGGLPPRARTVEIQKADAARLYGPDAIWKDVGQRLLDNTCTQRTVVALCSNECGQDAIDPIFQGHPKGWGYPGPSVVSDNRMPISAAR